MPRGLDLDLGSGHMAYRRASLIDLYLHTKFHSNRSGRTYVRMDGQTSRTPLLGRLLRVRLTPPSKVSCYSHKTW